MHFFSSVYHSGFSSFISIMSGVLATNVVHAESTSTSSKIKLVNENGISISYADYNRLQSLDFSDDEINGMEQEEFDMNKDLEGEEVSEQTEYIKVTEQNQNIDSYSTNSVNKSSYKKGNVRSRSKKAIVIKEQKMSKAAYLKEVKAAKKKVDQKKMSIQVSDSTSTSYKTVTTSAIKLSSRKLRVKNRVVWNLMPSNRDVDVIGVAINDNFARNKSSAYGKQSWNIYDYDARKYKKGSATYSPSKKASLWDIGDQGFGVKMNLKNNDKIVLPGTGYIGTEVRESSLYMYYNVGKVFSSVKRLDAYGRYAHAVVIPKPSFGFSLSTSGAVGISFTLNKVDDFQITKNTVATLKL